MNTGKTGYSLAEAVVTVFIIGVLTVVVAPMMTQKKVTGNLENNSVICVKVENADEPSELTSEACQKSIDYCKNNAMRSCFTLKYYADHGTDSQQKSARTVLKEVCDKGGDKACEYFVQACIKDSDKCDIASSSNDLHSYLSLAKSDATLGRFRTRDMATSPYRLGNSNIVNLVDNLCCNPDMNTACDVKSLTDCPPVTYSWGDNEYGQLGHGHTTTPITTPTEITTETGFSRITAGRYHSCGLKDDGSAWCWGLNNNGQLGLGHTTTPITTPTEITSETGFSQIAGGRYHSCGLKDDGSAWCWGDNTPGQLGLGHTTTPITTPTEITSQAGFSQISAGYSHTCGLKDNGSVWCWGQNAYGQLGLGHTTTPITTPTEITSETGFSQIAGGYNHTCGLKDDGGVWCWGRNDNGQLGLGHTTTPITTPTEITSQAGFSRIITGYYHTCGLKDDGSAWCWGRNDDGQLGLGHTTTPITTPTEITSQAGFSRITVGAGHTCGLKDDGSAWCWGWNNYGQLGLGDSGVGTERTTPTEITSVTGFIHINAGGYYTLGIIDD